MGISKIIGQSVAYASRATAKVGEFYNKDPEKAIAYTTVGSVIVKDGIGCYRYVTQSLDNDRIPDDKRKFVAALDLTNGVLMIAAQIAMFFLTRHYSEKIFDSVFKNTFGKKALQYGISRIRMAQEKLGMEVEKKLTIEKDFEKARKHALDIFKFVLELSASTIIGKRVIVPLIATPLADKVQTKMNSNVTSSNHQKTETKNINNQNTDISTKNKINDEVSNNIPIKSNYKKYYGFIKK